MEDTRAALTVASGRVDRLDGAADVERLRELVRSLLERNRQLEHALESRIVIEQAKGVLAERYAVDTATAFEALRRVARNRRVKIHDLARDVVAGKAPSEIAEALAR